MELKIFPSEFNKKISISNIIIKDFIESFDFGLCNFDNDLCYLINDDILCSKERFDRLFNSSVFNYISNKKESYNNVNKIQLFASYNDQGFFSYCHDHRLSITARLEFDTLLIFLNLSKEYYDIFNENYLCNKSVKSILISLDVSSSFINFENNTIRSITEEVFGITLKTESIDVTFS